MTRAILVHAYGGPEVLQPGSVEVGAPGPGEVHLRHTAIGLNYIDVYIRTGAYPQPSFPFVPGMEGAGEVVACGPDVTGLAVGDRVAYAGPIGAYCAERLIPADRVVKLPAEIADETAAAMMLQGMTVHYLFHRTFKVGPQTTMLFHAAAGGVGLIACQWARHLGATLIGTAGTDEKCALAMQHGATHMINYQSEDVTARVAELTEGKGVDVVYDSVGQAMLDTSLDSLRTFGLFVSYGAASGPITNFDIGVLAKKGSLFMTRPTLFNYIAERDDLVAAAEALFDVVARGIVDIRIAQRFALEDAGDAHRALEARQTTGSTILTV
ncbi:MAG: quinone oxidoreductase [Pseudomonadota bacterium]